MEEVVSSNLTRSTKTFRPRGPNSNDPTQS